MKNYYLKQLIGVKLATVFAAFLQYPAALQSLGKGRQNDDASAVTISWRIRMFQT